MKQPATAPLQTDTLAGVIVSVSTPARGKPSNVRKTGCTKIVGFKETVVNSTPTEVTTVQRTMFTPAAVLTMADESTLTVSTPNTMPAAAWQAAHTYYCWLHDVKKKPMPEFGDVIDLLCQQRVTLWIGLGGCIYFENAQDAANIAAYYR